jgi:hypothetical protein
MVDVRYDAKVAYIFLFHVHPKLFHNHLVFRELCQGGIFLPRIGGVHFCQQFNAQPTSIRFFRWGVIKWFSPPTIL